MAHAGGRPTDYTPELADHICAMLACGTTPLHRLAKQNDTFPAETNIYKWMWKYPEFRQKYLDAKEAQAILIADEIMQCLWDTDERTEAIAKMNLVLNGAKWHLSKLAPKQFGDKKHVTQDMNLNVHEQDLANLK